jgi:tetratricopeptide (TPR) repeat protein
MARERAIALWEKVNSAYAHVLRAEALISSQDYAAAQKAAVQALRLAREQIDQRIEIDALYSLASIATAQGDVATAQTYHGETLRIVRELGDRMGEGAVLHNLGGRRRSRGTTQAREPTSMRRCAWLI